METQIIKQEKITIIKVSGRLDSSNFESLGEEINSQIESGLRDFILDFEALEYISSAGLRVILVTMKKLTGIKGKLRLCSMQGFIKEVFDLSGFSAILKIDESLEESLKEIKRG